MAASAARSFWVRPEAYAITRVDGAESRLQGTNRTLASMDAGAPLCFHLEDDAGKTMVAPLPPGAKANRTWTALSLLGPFGLDEVGVMADFLGPLAQANVPAMAFSTFDTDHVLVPAGALDAALGALERAGWTRSTGAESRRG